MKLTLTIEKLKTKDKKLVNVLSTTLRTDIKTGKQVWNEEKGEKVDELLTIHGMGEIPEDDPLMQIAKDVTLSLLEANKKQNESKADASKDESNSKKRRKGSKEDSKLSK